MSIFGKIMGAIFGDAAKAQPGGIQVVASTRPAVPQAAPRLLPVRGRRP